MLAGGIPKGPEFDGNSILLQLQHHNNLDTHKLFEGNCIASGHNIYVYIGSEIFSFQTNCKIISYVSPVGNNDVPYPYAIDENDNVYLIIENVVIKNNSIVKQQMCNYDNPYDYYYDYHLITKDSGTIPSKEPKIKNFYNIDQYYIGSDRYTLIYHPEPEKDYDRLVPNLGKSMYIVDITGKKTTLTKEMYVELIKSFGVAQSFEPIKDKNVLHKRLW